MTIYDITRPLSPHTAVFPGDVPVRIAPTMQMRNGDSCNVTAITLSTHAGTHVDAPRHYNDEGCGVDAIPLDVLIGPARVISLTTETKITTADLQRALEGRPFPMRLLIHTPASERREDVWSAAFSTFAPDVAEWLGASGLRLIGTDAPSVDPAESKDLPAHRAFLRHGVFILENICLRDVPDGDYELIALPLRLVDGDAAPTRAVLIKR
jgi:arylformamidase